MMIMMSLLAMEDDISEHENELINPQRVLYMQMEYCRKSLRSAIDEGLLECVMSDDDVMTRNSGDLTWRIFRQIVHGLEYLHDEGIYSVMIDVIR